MKRPKQWFKKLPIILKKDFNNYGECCLTIFKKKVVVQMLPNNFEEKTFTVVEKVA
jgi:hypothetical protein